MAGRALRGLTALLTGIALVLLGAAPASAHSGLNATIPADGAEVDASPAEVVLEFDEPVSTRLSRVQVTGPAGDTWQTGAPEVSGSTVRQPLASLGPAGTYQVAYRVVSADGHPVSGTSSFTLTAAGTGTAPQQAAAGQDAGQDGGGLPVLPLAGGALLVIAGAVLVLRRRNAPAA